MPDTNINTIKHHEHADSNTNCPTPSPLKQHEHQHPTVVAPKEVTRHRTSWAAYRHCWYLRSPCVSRFAVTRKPR